MENQIMINNQNDIQSTTLAAAAQAEIQAGYLMALKTPRNEDETLVKIKKRCKNLSFAESALYQKPVGGSTITGLSIRFTEDLLALWKNIKIIQNIVFEDEEKIIANVNVCDLENNTSYSSNVTVKKTVERKFLKSGQSAISSRTNSSGQKVYLVNATEDDINNKLNAQISKAIRNNGLRCLPGYIKEECIEEIKKTLKSGIDNDPDSYKRKLLDAMGEINILPSDLEKYFKNKVDKLSKKQLEELRGIYSAIKNGEAVWSDYIKDDKVDTNAANDFLCQSNIPSQPVQEQQKKQTKKTNCDRIKEAAESFEKINAIDVYNDIINTSLTSYSVAEISQLTDKTQKELLEIIMNTYKEKKAAGKNAN